MNPKTDEEGNPLCVACFGCLACAGCVPASTILAFSTMGANSVVVG